MSDFETKKSVHINLTKSTHSSLRVALIKRGLSMQETFDYLASLICENDPDLIEKLDEIEMLKRNKKIKQVRNSDADSVYRMINQDSPID